MKRLGSLILLLTAVFTLRAQAPMPAKSGAEILHDLHRLQVVGRVLYVAAHPDDENQRIITWFARGEGYETGYLALTRGDGGQNLIGDEKGPSLGMLRTQELLGARRIDGGRQFFTRAYDFGYSKTPEETLTKWDKETILGDVVWTIRKFRPDVIVTRFATPEKGGGGHGHHTTSAILAHEAFEMAGDPTAYPEQLQYVDTWQPKRLFWNNYWVFRRHDPTEEEMANIITVNIGEYNPLLGKSYGEIASEARSMHKCQAFGAALLRGSMNEYLEYELGERPENGDIFSGINTTWERLGLPEADRQLAKIVADFDVTNPAASVDQLLDLHDYISNRPASDGPNEAIIQEKKQQLEKLILYCAGIWVEANAPQSVYSAWDSIRIQIEILKRTEVEASVKHIFYASDPADEPDFMDVNERLIANQNIQRWEVPFETTDFNITMPYWLYDPNPEGMFLVHDKTLIGRPESPEPVRVGVTFDIQGHAISVDLPVTHRYVDRAEGELYRPVVIAPPLTVNISEPVYLFAKKEEQTVRMVARGAKAGSYDLTIQAPDGWVVSPATMTITIDEVGQEVPVTVDVTPPENSSVGKLEVLINAPRMDVYSLAYNQIAYDHIPTQVWFPEASAKLARVNLEKRGSLIGYLMGSGDEVPEALRQVGYEVELIDPESVTSADLMKYDAVVCGIRAYNTLERMPYIQDQVLEYVNQGGTYVVQYQTSYGMTEENPGPYPLSLGRDRISVEEAELTFLEPDHPALNVPNKLTEKDFEGWVQERGLYFAGEWDERYTPLIAGHDPGEDEKKGALLVARYGDGWFVYTGISFFRELPAGVPGAYRLLVNLISLGQEM